MKLGFEKPNIINFGVDVSQIANQAGIAAGVDYTPAFNAITSMAEKKMQSKKNMAIMDNESKVNSVLDHANSIFSDGNLYKDSTRLQQERDSFEKKFSTAYDDVMNINMSEEERRAVYSKYDKMKKHLDDKINAQQKLEEFNQQQQKINLSVTEATNRVMSGAYSGHIDYLDENFKFVEKSINGQVEKGLMTQDKATEFLGNVGANASIIASSKNDINAILNSDLSTEEKVQEMKALKSKYSDDKFIKNLSNELSKDTSLSPATAEMFLRENIGKVEKIANMEINHIVNSNKVEAFDIKNVKNNLGKLDLKQRDKFKNYILKGEKYEAYSFYAENTNQVFEFKNRDDFYNNKQIQKDLYGQEFNLKDITDSTVPTNTLPQQAVQNIAAIGQDPINQLSISKDDFNSMTQFDLQNLMYKKAIDTVKYFMDTDDDTSAMKYLIGQDIPPIQTVQNGRLVTINMNDMATARALIDDSTPDSKVKRLTSENIIAGNFSRVIGNIQNYSALQGKRNDEKRAALRVQMGDAGIAIPKNLLDGDDKPLIKMKDFYTRGALTFSLTSNLQQIIEEINPKISQEELVNNYVDIKQLLTSSESEKEELMNYAITIYNSQGYVEEEDLANGITRKNLLNKKVDGKTAMDEAIDLYIRKKYRYDTIGSEGYNPIK